MNSATSHPPIIPTILLLLFAGLVGADGQLVQLSFPLNSGQFTNPWTAPVTSVFDHSMLDRFTSNGVVIAYTGEAGTVLDANEPPASSGGQLLYSYKKADGTPFLINGHYVGTATTGSNTLNYDGHPGYDYPVTSGTPVYAAADGIVLNAVPTDSGPSGKYIQIEHTGTSYLSQYLHLSRVDVTNNQVVRRGDPIGLSGNSGGVAAHLHFETKINMAGQWVSVDPYGWQGSGVDPYTNAANVCLWATPFGEVITNVMSPIVSYQYPDDLGSQALTNGGIQSPIASYQYMEWPGDDVLQLKSSPWVSYYYQFLDAPVLIIAPTNRLATVAETTPQYLPPPPSLLEVFTNGMFQTNMALNPNAMTIVLTHGWIPVVNVLGVEVVQFGVKGIDGWPTAFAAQLRANGIASANIVGWNWEDAAKSILPGRTAARTAQEGIALGQSLLNQLGPNYSQPIHFVGHSFGTLVNAYAANFLHGDRWANEPASATPWAATNTQMTLFDEAEVGTGISTLFQGLDTIKGNNGNPFYPMPAYEHPLPKRFQWADNYVAAVGLLHPEAANVILTNNFPASASSPESWITKFTDFHGYPVSWYDKTIQSDVSAMGFLWSFERGGWFAQAPASNSVFVQSFNGSEWNLTPTNWNYGTNLLNERFDKYRSAVVNAISNQTPGVVSANGSVSGENIVGALPALNSFLLSLVTTPWSTAPAPQMRPQPFDGQPDGSDGAGDTNIPAYAWVPLEIPANALSMSFAYQIKGDWNGDSLAAAINGTNVLSISGSLIETNAVFNSGPIDVTAYAGHTNEFFVGIVGGTSTNAQLTVMSLAFYVAAPPSLSMDFTGTDVNLSWPLASQNFSVETTTNLSDTGTWTTSTNSPAVVDLRNTITDSASNPATYYRLKK